MAINKSMRRVLKALSFDGIEVEASRHLANLKAIDPMKIFHKTIDYKIYNGNHQIPVRIFPYCHNLLMKYTGHLLKSIQHLCKFHPTVYNLH